MRHAARAITLQSSRHTPCAVAEPPSRVATVKQLHRAKGTSNTQRESVTAHGVCLLHSRRGITLLELLVVMLILLMVTAAAIPIIAPAMQNRQMRESTRLVTSFMGAAKARAVQTGRPVGVMIERFEPSAINGGAFALQMSQVEVPPPYSGDVIGSKVAVAITNSGATAGEQPNTASSKTTFDQIYNQATHTMSAVWFAVTFNSAELNVKLLKIGDQIQFGNQAYSYTIFGPDANGDKMIDTGQPLDVAYVYADNVDYTASKTPPRPLIDNIAFPWANTAPAAQSVTYQVFRQPVRTSSPPLQLPEGIVFDLSISGSGNMLFNTANYNVNIGTLPVPVPTVLFDPQIIFSPSGRVEWVSNAAGQLTRPTDPIFLLLGRRELMFDVTNRNSTTDGRDLVFQNLSPPPPPATPTVRMPPTQNFWVVVGHQTGQVNTSEVAPHVQDYTNGMNYTFSGTPLATYADVIRLACFGTTTPNTVTGALTYARESQSLGGR